MARQPVLFNETSCNSEKKNGSEDAKLTVFPRATNGPLKQKQNFDPEVPLNNFRFPVGGCLAAWQAISLPKVTLLGPKNVVFGPNSFFCGQTQKNCYNHNGTPKRQPFCFDCISGGLWEAVQVLFGPKIDYKSDFLRFTFITYLFHLSRTRLNAIIIV